MPEIQKIEYKYLTKKGAEETHAIEEAIDFFDGARRDLLTEERFGGYGKLEEDLAKMLGKPKSEWDEHWIRHFEFKTEQNEMLIGMLYYKHLHENR